MEPASQPSRPLLVNEVDQSSQPSRPITTGTNISLNKEYKESIKESTQPPPTFESLQPPHERLINLFTQLTAILPPPDSTSKYKQKWYAPVDALLLMNGGDLDSSCEMVVDAIDILKSKRYTITCPKSLSTTLANMEKTVKLDETPPQPATYQGVDLAGDEWGMV